jgi:opacity protein-like surface antigen
MKKVLALLVLSARLLSAQSADVAGTWKAEFDTQVGAQKYLYSIKREGTALTGTAKGELGGQSRDVQLKDVKLAGDTLTFSETFEFQGNAVPITYTGIVAGDQIRFVRKVGEFATEEFVAKREKPAGA